MAYDVLLVNGKIENILTGEDFARLLNEKLGSDAERYFRKNWLVYADYDPEQLDEDFKAQCDGECDHVYEQQEHYQNVLQDIKESVVAMMNTTTTAKRAMIADQIYEKINYEL